MRGLSLVGLLVALGVAGVLFLNQLKPSPTEEALPTQTIDKANEAVDTMQQEQDAADALDQKVDQMEQNVDNLPE